MPSKVNSELLDQQLKAEAPVAEASCPRLRDMWLQESNKDEPNLDIKFQYALTLIKTRSHDRNREGMSLLEGLAESSYHVGECYYSMALALYRMGRYEECRSMVEIVLRMDPDMPAAQTLHKAVQEAVARRNETVRNVAAGGAAVAGLGILVGALLSRR
ncbi:unnamed protein product [Ectocarpus sp. 6 AP-2014]